MATNDVIRDHVAWPPATQSTYPFSMPQGGMEALLTKNPLEINVCQYDIVCNGVQLSSGAIRNHVPEIMYKAFKVAGYSPEVVERKFGSMINAFKLGAPRYGGRLRPPSLPHPLPLR